MRRALALSASWLLAAAAAAESVVLSGGTVIDGYGGPPIANGVVVIEGERILAVGGRGQVLVPEGAQVISTEGMTVLPGLWDLQVRTMRLGHGDAGRWNETYGPLAERVVMPIAARQLLQAGVTSARDVMAPLEGAINVRRRIREHLIEGPTLYVSGPALRKLVPPGTEAWQWAVNGAADARARVARLADAGVDYLLLAEVDLWSAEELGAAVAEARARNLPVHAFAERPADVERGVELQFDGFLGTSMGVGPFPDNAILALHQRLLQPSPRPLAWSPAISALLNFESLRGNAEPLDDPRATEQMPALVAADILGSLSNPDRVAWFEMPASKAHSMCEKLRQLDEARVTLLVGSDAGVPGHLHSRATWQEIDFWVRDCGIPAERAIRAATHDAATAMGAGHETGTLAPGKIADVIAVRGDVLRNPGLLQNVDVVIKRGRRVR
ncbi:MAG TPA: amidohydrolase family protein [Steroidobacteraceae bacterium]|nr:amidohydrolase family protein [Steroidobacteraceae bacterium]